MGIGFADGVERLTVNNRILSFILTVILGLSGAGYGATQADIEQPDALPSTVFIPFVAHNWRPGISVYPQDRQASADFFNQVYRASDGVSADWTGDRATCNAGTTAAAFKRAVELRINYFRAMAGVPGIVQLSAEYSHKAQLAALMMSVNGQLSHSPPPTWQCYSADGATAASKSNLYLGVYGPAAITGYILDPGANNTPVGHRRWILYPQTQSMGTGDIPPTSGGWAANALWVFDEHMWEPRPETREEFVAWPPPGYVPYQIVFPRWSFSYDDADFSTASVEMSSGGSSVPLSVKPVVNGYGENTLVWEPASDFSAPPQSDTVYTVEVRNVAIGGGYRDFSYGVIVFNPDSGGSTLPGLDETLGTPPKVY